MNEKSFIEFEAIERLVREGKYKEALALMTESKYLKRELAFDIFNIWIGTATYDEVLINKGISSSLKKINKPRTHPEDIAQAHYNIGNGYSTLFEIKLNEGISLYDDNVQQLIKKCRQHYEKVPLSHSFTELAKTNLANLFDTIGRPIESIKNYEQTLRINPDHAMATANMAMAVASMAHVSTYEGAYYIYAYQLYQKALSNSESIVAVGGVSSLNKFEKQAAYIWKMYENEGDTESLSVDMTHPHRSEDGLGEWIKRYTKFCIDKDLYLNLHIHDKNSDASLGDPLVVSPLTPIGNNKVADDIFFRLNEIKESFMTARYMFAQSQLPDDQTSQISDQTTLINIGYSASNLYVGMLKAAYKETVGVLDKMAILINHYLKLENEENDPRLDYRKVWFKDLTKSNGLHDAITDKKNSHYLHGVFSILQEIDKLDHGLRNALTHRYAKVYIMMADKSKDSYSYQELVEKTTKLQYLTKCAIISLVMFVNHIENSKKKSSIQEGKIVPSMPLWSDQMLDAWPSHI